MVSCFVAGRPVISITANHMPVVSLLVLSFGIGIKNSCGAFLWCATKLKFVASQCNVLAVAIFRHQLRWRSAIVFK